MRAHEFLKENATTGGTAAGNVATVVKPLLGKNKQEEPSFFGGDPDDFPGYGDTNIAIIRRPSPTSKK